MKFGTLFGNSPLILFIKFHVCTLNVVAPPMGQVLEVCLRMKLLNCANVQTFDWFSKNICKTGSSRIQTAPHDHITSWQCQIGNTTMSDFYRPQILYIFHQMCFTKYIMVWIYHVNISYMNIAFCFLKPFMWSNWQRSHKTEIEVIFQELFDVSAPKKLFDHLGCCKYKYFSKKRIDTRLCIWT